MCYQGAHVFPFQGAV